MTDNDDKRQSLLGRLSRGVAYTAPALALVAGGAAFQASASEVSAESQDYTILAEAEGESHGEAEGEAHGEAEGEGEGEGEGEAHGEAEGEGEGEGEGEAEGESEGGY